MALKPKNTVGDTPQADQDTEEGAGSNHHGGTCQGRVPWRLLA